MKNHTILFDLDGTLADTAPDLLSALTRITVKHGLKPVERYEIGHLVGRGTRNMIFRAYDLQNLPHPTDKIETILTQFMEDYEENIAIDTALFPGVLAAIDKLETQGAILAVCTNKPQKLAKLLLDKLGLSHRFAAICGGDQFEFCKPNFRHLTATIELAGGSLNNAVMIGDSIADIAAAKGAGIPVIAVDFGYSSVPVRQLEPDAVISHFDELIMALTPLTSGMIA